MGLTSKLDRSASPYFQPCEIVCLECDSSLLYAEVVQTVKDRQVCWVHPLVLTINALNHSVNDSAPLDLAPLDLAPLDSESLTTAGLDPACYDLRESADLLLPAVLFRSAFDIEVIPLIAHLHNPDAESRSDWSHGAVQHRVNHLIKRLCQMHPEAF